MSIDNRFFEYLNPGENFVELGCGDGRNVDVLSKNYENSIGIDFTDAQMSGDVDRGWMFLKADLNERFPLDAGWADCVLANQVIEHIYNPNHFAREIFRCVKPGGRVIVTTPNIRYLKNIWWIMLSGYGPRTAGGHTLDGEWDDGHIHYFTHKDLYEIFSQAGFKQIRSRSMINMSKPNLIRKFLDKNGDSYLIREFLAGNLVMVADK